MSIIQSKLPPTVRQHIIYRSVDQTDQMNSVEDSRGFFWNNKSIRSPSPHTHASHLLQRQRVCRRVTHTKKYPASTPPSHSSIHTFIYQARLYVCCVICHSWVLTIAALTCGCPSCDTHHEAWALEEACLVEASGGRSKRSGGNNAGEEVTRHESSGGVTYCGLHATKTECYVVFQGSRTEQQCFAMNLYYIIKVQPKVCFSSRSYSSMIECHWQYTVSAVFTFIATCSLCSLKAVNSDVMPPAHEHWEWTDGDILC